MKKYFLIIALCVIQSACAGQAPNPGGSGALLTFSDLASEITVGVETTDTPETDRLPDDLPLGTP